MVQPTRKNETDELRPYLRAAHLPAPGTLSLNVSEQQMYFSPAELGRLDLQKDDVVIVEGGAGYGRSAYLDDDLNRWGFQNSIVRVRPCPDVSVGRYVYYALQHAQADRQIELEVSTATLPHFTAEKVGRFRLPLPPLETQRAIANYLDRETAEIDGMRADLDEMERLLTERRVSVAALHIFGDSDDSSFPRLSLKMVTDKTFAGEWGKDEGEQQVDRPCVRVADFNRKTNMVNSEVPTIRSYTPKNVAEKTLKTGDLLIEKSGGTNINPVGNVIEYVGPDGPLCSNFIQVVRLNTEQHPRYWQQAHLAAYQTGITNLHVHQTTGIQNLDLTGFTSEKYPAPPLAEQRRIADEIDRETAEIDSMLEDITKLRDLLAERRSAVISAAVTGQIDIPVSPTYKDEAHA